MKSKYLFFLFLLFLMSFSLSAQSLDYEDVNDMQYAGFSFTMAETGSGLGGLIAWPIFKDTHLGINLGAYFLRDENEVTIQPYGYYSPVNLNKENNVYLFDFMVSAKRRFFSSDLDDSMRPFLTAAIGPYYGMNYPEYSEDIQGNKTFNQFAWTLGGFIGVGIDFDASANYFMSVRAQYRVIPFREIIGERKNHSMFELRFEIANRY